MMFPKDLPSPASVFSTYASVMGFYMMIKPMLNTLVPVSVQNYVVSYIKSLIFGSRKQPTILTLVINEYDDTIGMGKNRYMPPNAVYFSVETYLSSKISPDALKLKITRNPDNKKVDLHLSQGEVVSDIYEGIELKWQYLSGNKKSTTAEGGGQGEEYRYFQLSFDKKHRDLVLNSYVPYVETKAKVIQDERRILKMFSYAAPYSHHSYSHTSNGWQPVNFEHPSTFEKMAMNNELKRSVMEDLDRFIRRKDYYKRVGKAWKRGYLLYGPPGTGKTSLVAAMANYLKFDVYDLQLASVSGDADLRNLLLTVRNSSILLIEDIDCSVDLPTRSQVQPPTTMINGTTMINIPHSSKGSKPFTLSGLLNCIDGLWSSCGNERIIIFTTNNKDMLDPALLRPGRMDMHIYMGHCCFEGFKTLASTYLGLSPENDETHPLYPDIKRLIDGQVLTPAQVAEELLKEEDTDMALEGLVKVLKKKRSELENSDDETKKKMKSLGEGEQRKSDGERPNLPLCMQSQAATPQLNEATPTFAQPTLQHKLLTSIFFSTKEK